jgi:hypothetical protein
VLVLELSSELLDFGDSALQPTRNVNKIIRAINFELILIGTTLI